MWHCYFPIELENDKNKSSSGEVKVPLLQLCQEAMWGEKRRGSRRGSP